MFFCKKDEKNQEKQAMQAKLTRLRSLYVAVSKNEKAWKEMKTLLSEPSDLYSPVFAAYEAAFCMISALYTNSPLQKYTAFQKGKKMLERILTEHPESMEIRYLRLTIQQNLPAILGYNHTFLDKQFIEKHFSDYQDQELKQKMADFWESGGWGDLWEIEKRE